MLLVSFSSSELLAATEQNVIESLCSVQELIDPSPYTTRLYSTPCPPASSPALPMTVLGLMGAIIVRCRTQRPTLTAARQG